MPLVRAYDGPRPSHPVVVVPDDPARRGALVKVRGWEVAVADPVAEVRAVDDLVEAAEGIGWADDIEGVHNPSPPFTDGLVGFLTDDVSADMVGLPALDRRPAPAPLPPVWFGEYAHAACQDPSGRWWLTGRTPADLDRAEALLCEAGHPNPSHRNPSHPHTHPPSVHPTSAHPASAHPVKGTDAWTTVDRPGHADAVRQVQAWIADGDVYQVNLTLHIGARWEASPRSLALGLFGASHGAAHAAYLHAPTTAPPGRDPGAQHPVTIASVSPETFLRTDGRRARIRPIKGTRRRAADPATDRRLAADLRAAAKDGAEHVMIVDLERNDLGRISVVGSVAVPELMALEGHPTVWHLTSTVTSRLRDEIRFGDLLAALFPCGSVTGAPKRMAVDRIRLLEPWRRGVYCGAIGVITRGMVDLSVAIRTAVLHGGTAWYGAGGGIVADSDPDAEWDEAMAKAAPFFTATGTRPPLSVGGARRQAR